MPPVQRIAMADIYAARERIADITLRTPLVRLNVDDAPAEIYLKLENLQPAGAFKLRGVINAMRLAREEDLDRGVWTVSSGNAAIAVAWGARKLGIGCSVLVTDDSPRTKVALIERLGARTVKIPWSMLLETCRTRRYEGMEGMFIHPFSDPDVMAGNATIGVEIIEDLPDVDAVVVPYGGGGLACSIGSAVRTLRPETRLYAAEVDTTAPVAASFIADGPSQVEQTTSWVSGIGLPFVFEDIWPLVKELLDGSLVSSLAEVASAIKLMAEHNHVIAEGAGAAPVAAALAGRAGAGRVACVITGGNIDTEKVVKILEGGLP